MILLRFSFLLFGIQDELFLETIFGYIAAYMQVFEERAAKGAGESAQEQGTLRWKPGSDLSIMEKEILKETLRNEEEHD